jgi:uncharacterized protein with ATP-grasp and redox domains
VKTYLECIPCFFKQAIEAAKFSKASQKTQKRILDEIAKVIPKVSFDTSPPEMGRIIYGAVEKHTKRRDPFKRVKAKSNKLALRLYPALKNKVAHSRDRLLTAIELAIAGNIIDYGVKNTLNVDKEIKKILQKEHEAIKRESSKLFNYVKFKRALKKAKTILYLADNAGEVVFDRILIEEIKRTYKDKRIIYAVKGRPIINDALMKDARQCGINRIVEVVSTGLAIPGTILSMCSKEFRKIYKDADVIISKGQGNFESVSEQKKPTFFLFMAKCPVVTRYVGCHLGDIILLYNLEKERRS